MGLFRKKHHEQVRQPRITDENDAYAFRRSRTITGSLSNSVRAANENRSDLKSSRLKTHDLRQHRRLLFTLLLGCLVVVAGLAGLLTQFISSVNVSLASLPDAQKIKYAKEVDKYLFSHPSERFYFSLQNSELTKAVQATFPEVKQITLEPSGVLKPAGIKIVLRQPIASWTIRGQKLYIDERGEVFKDNFSSEPALAVEDKTGIDPADAGAVASDRMLHFTGRLVALVQASGLKIEKIELPPRTSREIDLRLEGRAYVVRTNLDRDPAGQAADVVSAIKYIDSKGLVPQYVDVRVSSRAYYR